MGSSRRGEDPMKQMEELSKTLKDGERIVAPTRRPDGTLRKPIRIRAGHVSQDEVAKYKSKGALLKEVAAQVGPPGYDPEADAKPKTKSAKRNARKKEKRGQAGIDKDKNSDSVENDDAKVEEDKAVESLTPQLNELTVSINTDGSIPPSDSTEGADVGGSGSGQDIDKKIRALKKKIRLAEAQLQKTSPQEMKTEQMEKLFKIEGWREELKLLEDEKSAAVQS